VELQSDEEGKDRGSSGSDEWYKGAQRLAHAHSSSTTVRTNEVPTRKAVPNCRRVSSRMSESAADEEEDGELARFR